MLSIAGRTLSEWVGYYVLPQTLEDNYLLSVVGLILIEEKKKKTIFLTFALKKTD